MGDLLELSLLPGGQYGFSAALVEQHRFLLAVKIAGGKLASVQQRQHKAVTQRGAQLLHQVQRKGRTARTQRVQIPGGRVQPYGFHGGLHLAREQHVGKRQQCVHLVPRRAAAAGGKAEPCGILLHHQVKPRKIGGSGSPLDPAHGAGVFAQGQALGGL